MKLGSATETKRGMAVGGVGGNFWVNVYEIMLVCSRDAIAGEVVKTTAAVLCRA